MDAYDYYKMHCFWFLGQTNVLLLVCFHLPNQAYDGLLSFSPVSLLVSGNYRQNISQLGFFFHEKIYFIIILIIYILNLFFFIFQIIIK
jgi:hypothetical protein